jgi:hypothetical protein
MIEKLRSNYLYILVSIHFSVSIIFYILPYLFVNILFKCHSIGSEFQKFGYENDKLFI